MGLEGWAEEDEAGTDALWAVVEQVFGESEEGLRIPFNGASAFEIGNSSLGERGARNASSKSLSVCVSRVSGGAAGRVLDAEKGFLRGIKSEDPEEGSGDGKKADEAAWAEVGGAESGGKSD